MTVSLVQAQFGASAQSFGGAPASGNLMVACSYSGGNDTYTHDNRDGSCSQDSRLAKYGKAGTNFTRSSGANAVSISGKQLAGDLYQGPWNAGPNCNSSGDMLLLEFSGIFVVQTQVLISEGTGSNGIGGGVGSFAFDFGTVGPNDLVVFGLVDKRDGYGGSPAIDISPNGFSEIIDGYGITNGWVWAGWKVGSGDASISYNVHDGTYESWGAIAVLFQQPAGRSFSPGIIGL